MPDVNVLVAAARPAVVQHESCRRWLDAATQADSPFALSELALSATLRVLTHRRIFKDPLDQQQAWEYVDALRRQQNCVVLRPGNRNWSIFERLCRSAAARGSLFADAYHAALAIEHGCTWITLDRGFARFEGLSWRLPA